MGILKCLKWKNSAYENTKALSKSNTKTLKKLYQYGSCETCQEVTCKKRIKIYKPKNFKK